MEKYRSKLHRELLEFVRKGFPFEKIQQNFYIRSGGRNLEFDLYLPTIKTMVEIHGQQHYERSTLFHKTKEDFMAQQYRDEEKEEWCSLNGYSYAVLPHDIKRDVDVIRDKILEDVG